MKNLHQNKNFTKYFNSIHKRIKNMTTSVETVIKLACTNLAGTLFFCIPCLKLLYELQAPIIGGGGGEMK